MPSIILAAHGRITSRHGQDIGRGWLHRGIDQGHNNGTAYDLEVRAPAAGRVTFAGLFGSYGLVIFITHDDGWVSVLAHHARHLVVKGVRVKQGQIVAVMGNSGTKYVHSHQELRDAAGAQVDPLKHLAAASAAANNLTPIGDDDMSAEAERNISNIYQAMFYGASWTLDGKTQTFKYGVLPIVAHNQTLIAQLAGKVGALVVAVNQISAGEPLNMTAIEDAAERGAKEALDGITVTLNLP